MDNCVFSFQEPPGIKDNDDDIEGYEWKYYYFFRSTVLKYFVLW